MRPVKALIFDLDGTLYLQSRFRRKMMKRFVVAHLGCPGRGLGAYRILQAYRQAQRAMRHPGGLQQDLSNAQLEHACRRTGANRATVLDAVIRWMVEEPLNLLPDCVRTGLPDLLVEARRAGIRLGVFSDYPATGKLRALGMDSYFETVVCAQDAEVQCLKPNPRGLLVTASRLGVEPADSVYVGDRNLDAVAASHAGMQFICINPCDALRVIGNSIRAATVGAQARQI